MSLSTDSDLEEKQDSEVGDPHSVDDDKPNGGKPRAKYDMNLIASLKHNSNPPKPQEGSFSQEESSSCLKKEVCRRKFDFDFIASSRRSYDENQSNDCRVENVTDQFKNCFISTNLQVKKPKESSPFVSCDRRQNSDYPRPVDRRDGPNADYPRPGDRRDGPNVDYPRPGDRRDGQNFEYPRPGDRRDIQNYDYPRPGDRRDGPHSYNEYRNNRFRPRFSYRPPPRNYNDDILLSAGRGPSRYTPSFQLAQGYPGHRPHRYPIRPPPDQFLPSAPPPQNHPEIQPTADNQEIDDVAGEDGEFEFPSERYSIVWGQIKRF